MSRIRITLLGVALLPILAAAPGRADPALDHVKQAGTLRVGTEGTYPPFTFHDASGDLTGFDVDLAREVGKRLGVKVAFLEGKWDGLIAGVDAGRYDVVVNEVGITDARKAKYDFSEPYVVSKAALIVRGDNAAIKDFSDLKGKKSAQTLTSNFARIAEKYGAEPIGTDGFDQSIALVLQRRADATINDSLSFYDFRKHKPDADVKIVALQGDADQSGILLPKGSPDFVAAVNGALDAIKRDGTYAAISTKYFGTDVSK
ncbi:MAG: amino acid ABC transporter substrate-binding protein [Janthinobacterium lividum]